MKIKTNGREATDDFFEKGLDGGSSYPFLIFSHNNGDVEVVMTTKVSEVLSHSDKTRVMKQWQGEWRSDFFHFSVGELRRFKDKEKQVLTSLFPLIESVNAKVNTQGRVEGVNIIYLDHEYLFDRPNGFYGEDAMGVMEEALSFNPKIVKVTKNSRNVGKIPDKEFDGESWLKSHEIFDGHHRSWKRIMSDKEKRRLGLAPPLLNANYRIELKDDKLNETHYYGGFKRNGKLLLVTNEFWTCAGEDTAERHLQKIKNSGDNRSWKIKEFIL